MKKQETAQPAKVKSQQKQQAVPEQQAAETSTNTEITPEHVIYSDPILIDYIIAEDKIEFVYKAMPLEYAAGFDKPHPKIWKDVYLPSGDKILKTHVVQGRYVPPMQMEESYEF